MKQKNEYGNLTVKIMSDVEGDKSFPVNKETIKKEIEPRLKKGHVLHAEEKGKNGEKVALKDAKEIDAKKHDKLYMRPAITAG